MTPTAAPRSIVWLASYPKSGNTWLRAQLTALLREGPVDLDRLVGGGLAEDRHLFDDMVGLDSSELRPDERTYYRSLVHLELAGECALPSFVKVHDRFSGGAPGKGLFPQAASAGAIYVARNPLDVAISLAHHNGESVDRAIARMADATATLNFWSDRISSSHPVELGGWSAHVESWIEQSVMPLLLLRYEDMVADPAGCLVRVAEFSGLAVDGHQIGDAVERASFPVLRRAEVERGFVERPASLSSFFREGRAGGWRSVLGADQVERLVRDHGEWMSRLGFLPQDG